MILRFVIIFLLNWGYVVTNDVENISIESVLDQVAIPTRIIEEFLQKPVKSPQAKKYIPYENVERTTVHYENSNGFIPLIYSSRSYELKHTKQNSTKTTQEDAVPRTNSISSSDQNRRSYDTEDQRDGFELLKVNNGTPTVANFKTFYDNSKDSIREDSIRSKDDSKKYVRNRDRDRGKRIQTYLDNYYTKDNKNDHHSHSDIGERQKTNNHQQEKFTRNYKQIDTGTYNSEKVSLPRTNYATVSNPKLNSNTHIVNTERTNIHKFKNPIVIEPSEYTVDVKLNGLSVQSTVSTSTPQSDTKSESGRLNTIRETKQKAIEHGNTGRTYDYADSRDFSDENADFMDEVHEKPRRIQKASRKRPSYFDSSKTLPKEHRETYDDIYDDQGRKRTKSKSRNRYQKSKPVQVIHEETYDNEDDNYDYNNSGQRNQQTSNTWNQLSPNLEISHSNGFEINQIEKPKLHIVPVNILSNFDHATALDNSQGFDISNAMITGFVHEGTMSTASPLVSSPNYLEQNSISSSTAKSTSGYSTAIPDVIVGQNSFQNPVQAFLMPNKLQQSLLNQYAQSTASPAMFAVTPSPSYIASSTISPNLQQMLNQVQASLPINQQLIGSQSQHQSSTDQNQSNSHDHENSDINNHNTDRHRGRNTYSHKYSQSTTPRSYFEKTNPTHKKKYDHNNGQFLASASLSVDNRHSNHRNHNHKRHRNNNHNNNHHHKYNNENDDSYSNNYDNSDDQNYETQSSNQQTTRQNIKNIVQPTIVPAIIHTGIGLINNQNQQLIPNSFFITNPQQNSQMFKITGISSNVDSMGGASNNVNNLINPIQKAQLPILGAKNVEIVNPNMNPNGNTNLNAIAINQIPAALVTTPIPIFTTTGFITSKQAFATSTQDPSNGDKLYNPINFVPNYDLVRSQSILNTNVVPNEQFTQQNLNLVPLIPGGNFYKNSQGAQLDLASKPKLSSDLEKYATEMFKESLKTMYNSQKWNHDIRNISLVDDSELAKLRNELLRIKSNIRDANGQKDILEAHHTEHKYRTVRPGEYRRPDSSAEYSHHHNHHSGHNHPRHNKHKLEINDFLTPPKINSFISKSPFHDKPQKKRPGHGPSVNGNHDNPRPRPRPGTIPAKSPGSEAQASSVVDYRYPVRPYRGRPHYSSSDYRRSQNYNYPSFTTPFPENDRFRTSMEYKSSERDMLDMNNQRTHNLMGLLMKNKQLPPGIQANSHSDKDAISQYFNQENNRMQFQAYRDVMNSFQKKSDSLNRPQTRLINTKRPTEKNDGKKFN